MRQRAACGKSTQAPQAEAPTFDDDLLTCTVVDIFLPLPQSSCQISMAPPSPLPSSHLFILQMDVAPTATERA
jgi:hypothetical protein